VVESLGDNVTSLTLLNVEAGRDGSDAQRVFESFILTSDKYNTSDNRGRMLARRATQFETVAAASARKENFRYVPEVELDNVNLTLELYGQNVTSTKNYIVYRTYLPTRETIARAEQTFAKHEARNESKLAEQIG
jgi:hypothetical protein